VKVLLAHPGTQTSFRIAAELHRLSALGAYYTGIAIAHRSLLERALPFLPRRWQRRLANRRIADVPAEKIHLRPLLEAWALGEIARGHDQQAIFHRRNSRFQSSIPDAAMRDAEVVIGFDTSSAILAQRCAQLAVPFLLDQTHPDIAASGNELIKRRYPDWADVVDVRRADVREAEKRERELATFIAVASSFSRDSLIAAGVDGSKIAVNPLGVDSGRFSVCKKSVPRPLRFLFVGAMIARKGIPLLLEAWRELGSRNAELWLVGPAPKKTLGLLPELPGMRYFGRLPPEELAAAFQQSDIFVFPSYCEGFGQVILEAMACGLPVITTTASAGPDIITHGSDGWLINRDDPAQLVAVMEECLAKPEVLTRKAIRARETAERFSWSAYAGRLFKVLTGLVRAHSNGAET
jgi:glycosyltransferase involved in cell wall biosynthesis